MDINDFTADLDLGDEDYVPSDVEPEIVEDAHKQTNQGTHDLSHGTEMQPAMRQRHVLPDATAERLYANWKVLIPTLVSPYLHYMSRTLGKPLPPNLQSISLCYSLSLVTWYLSSFILTTYSFTLQYVFL